MAKKKNTKKKRNKFGDVSPAQAMMGLKEEILEDVRRLSDGSQMSVYGLVEKGKQLLELEKLHGESGFESEESPQTDEGPIQPDASEDDF